MSAKPQNSMKPSRPAQRSPPHIADFSLGEDIDLVIGLTAAALAGNEAVKLATSHQHHGSHLMKAGLSAAVAASALKMMQREHQDHREHHHGHSGEHTRHHHSRGTLEENERQHHGHHGHHGSSAYHNEVQHFRENERDSDYSVHNLENHTHHHRRHSLDSIHSSRLLPVDRKNHSYNSQPDDTYTSASSQAPYGYTIPRSHGPSKDTTALDRLTAPDSGHHHVHFSEDYGQESSRSSR